MQYILTQQEYDNLEPKINKQILQDEFMDHIYQLHNDKYISCRHYRHQKIPVSKIYDLNDLIFDNREYCDSKCCKTIFKFCTFPKKWSK